jgi:ribosomal-protein-serine acetyltransferase
MEIKIDNDLYLKTLEMNDVEKRFKVINDNRDFLKKWLGWLDYILKVEDLENFTKNCITEEENKKGYTFGIYYLREPIGVISIKDVNYGSQKAEIGYWLEEKSNGKGVMTKSCKAVLNYCFEELKLNRIQILVATENYSSQVIPERLMFEKEGILRENECLYGKYLDNYSYSMLKKNWKK